MTRESQTTKPGFNFICKECGKPLIEPGGIHLTGTIKISPSDDDGIVTISGNLLKHHIGKECA